MKGEPVIVKCTGTNHKQPQWAYLREEGELVIDRFRDAPEPISEQSGDKRVSETERTTCYKPRISATPSTARDE